MSVKKYTSSEWEHFNRSRIMHRQRLYDLLNDNLHCHLIGIIADSGFGKSTLMYGYLSHESKNTLWCRFDDDESVNVILNQMIHILNTDHQIEAIVFDNCSIVSNEPAFTNLIPDILNLAPQATLFLIGSTLPKLPFVIMKAKDQYFELTYDDLSLDRQEIEMYFNDYQRMSLCSPEINLLYDKTEGWFASLQLIYAFLCKNHLDNLRSLDLNFLSDITDINEYFSYNLFEHQTPDMQKFLLESSPAIELDFEVMEELLGADNSSKFLSELREYHGFVRTTSNQKLVLHPLLRHFLYERYMKYNAGKCLSSHNRLAEIYEKKRNYLLAFSHAVAGNNYKSAIRLMKKISDRYNPIQLLNIIDGHLEEISPTLLFSNTSIFLQRCMPEELMSRLIQPLTDAIAYETDGLKTANLQHRLGTMYYHLGNIQMTKDLLEKSLTNSEFLQNTDVMAFNYQLLADCYLTIGDTSQALECARNALFLSEQNDIIILQVHTLETFSRIQLALNHVSQAKDYILQALELVSPDSYELFWLYTALSAVEIADNDPDAAVKHATAATQIVQDSICGYDIAYTHFILARALISCDRLEEASQNLKLAYRYSGYNGLLRLNIIDAQLQLESDSTRYDSLEKEKLTIIDKCNYCEFIKPALSESKAVSENTNTVSVPQPKASSRIIINTFGNFTVSCNHIPVTIKRSSSLRLLQLLIINREHFITRDYIIEQLFPDSSSSSANNNFNVALSVLRKSLDAALNLKTGNKSCILRENNRYRLNNVFFSIDAALFEERYDNLCSSSSDSLDSWLELAALFTGMFMSDYLYESFLSGERDRLTSYQKNVILNIARIYTQKEDFQNAFTYYTHVLEIDPYDEDVYYELIEMLLDNNLLVKANAISEKMKFHLEDEMGISCSQQLQSIFDYYQKHTRL